MTLGTDDLQSAGGSRFIIQLDIRTTACHVGSDGYRTVYTGISYDLCFQFMEFCIQYLVLDATLGQHSAQFLTGFDRDRTYQYRLSLCMGFHHCIDNGI